MTNKKRLDPESEGALEVVDMERKQEELQRLKEKEAFKKQIKPYTDGLPYNRERCIAMTKEKLLQAADNIVAAGKYLIWMQAEESNQVGLTSEEIFVRYFPDVSRSTLYNCMRLAKCSIESPYFYESILHKSKQIMLLEALEEEDLKELEQGGIVAGIKLEEVDRIPKRELKEKLRTYNKKIEIGTEQLKKAEARIAELEKSLADDRKRLYGDVIVKFSAEDQRSIEQLHYAHDQIWLAMTAIASIDAKNISLDFINIAAGLCLHIAKLATERWDEIVTVRPEVGINSDLIIDENYWDRLPFNARMKEKE